ncbi:hypothetical protein L218DRAFT_952996 [Marasmius fiardii PR-910]|nr:hypothetical protein L218DRAFT_952996 [Marasmius fiardii PR-910]
MEVYCDFVFKAMQRTWAVEAVLPLSSGLIAAFISVANFNSSSWRIFPYIAGRALDTRGRVADEGLR